MQALLRGLSAVLVLLPAEAAVRSAVAADPDPSVEAAFQALTVYEWGPARDALLPIDAALRVSHGNPARREELENRLAEILQGTATRAAKDYALTRLAEFGSPRCVPAVAKLLDDPELAAPARAALESIPGGESCEALLSALPRLAAPARIGVIHSLGRRGDVAAATALEPLLGDRDAAVACAALVALARIDSPQALQAVQAYVARADGTTDRLTAAEACLLIAKRLARQGRLTEAADLLHTLESWELESARVAIFLALLDVEPGARHRRLLSALDGQHDYLRNCAVQWIRHTLNKQEKELLADEFRRISPRGQAALFAALQGSRHAAMRSAALAALAGDDATLRQRAIAALATAGQAADVELLAHLAAEGPMEEREWAAESLRCLSAEGVDAELIRKLDSASPSTCVALIQSLAVRGSPQAVDPLLKRAASEHAAVRFAAYRALETLADDKALEALLDLLPQTAPGAEREAAGRAVWRSAQAIAPPERRSDPLLARLQGAAPATRAAILPVLGRLGGQQALDAIHRALQDPDRGVRDAAVLALSDWPDPSVADELLEWARATDQPSQRIRALRGFARLAAREGQAEPQRTYVRLREAFQLARRDEERRLILERLTAARVPDSLALVIEHLDDEQLSSTAIESAVALAEAMKDSYPAQARAALERVQKAPVDEDLQLHIAKLLWNMQLKGN